MPEAEALYETLAGRMLLHPAVQRGTMMGYPCLRFEGRFFACQHRQSRGLIVKLPKERVTALVESDAGRSFAPSGRVFREWVEVAGTDEAAWAARLEEAQAFAASLA